MQKKLVQKISLLAIVALSVLALFATFGVLHHDDGDSRIRFQLTNQSGQTTSHTDLQGQFLLVFFGFTHCPNVCPVQMSLMTQLMQNLDQQQRPENIQPVFISVDPQRDTPEVINQYLQHFDKRFIGLTGSDTALKQAATSFKTLLPKSSDEDQLPRHSPIIYVVDPNGRMIDYIPASADANMATRIVLKGLNAWI